MGDKLLPALEAALAASPTGDFIGTARFYRVIDDAPLELTGPEFWTALNLQLIHLLDFIPANDWGREWNRFTEVLLPLYQLLQRTGHLEVHLDLDLSPPATPAIPKPPMLFSLIMNNLVPTKVKRDVIFLPLIDKLNKAIGYTNECTLEA